MRPLLAALGLPLAAALALASPAAATTLFWEDFDGYWKFPSFDPAFDPVNLGLPEVSEGADELWFGARFETPDSACADGTVRFVGLRGESAPVSLASLRPGMQAYEVHVRFRREGDAWRVIGASYDSIGPQGIR